MLAAVKIKEEPLDVNEDLQEMLSQQEARMKQQFLRNKKTDTLPEESISPINNFHIVEELESIITINAGDMKSEDELQFIKTLNHTEDLNNKFNGVCSKCLKVFTNRVHFLKHTKRNHCIIKQKCIVCPVTFIDTASLLNHLKLHQDNVFFCSQHCGANFQTLPLCEEHELREHKTLNPQKIRYKYFCSFCREGFKTELQLHVHWLQQNQGCGKLMQDVVLHSTNIANNNDNDDKNTTTAIFNKNGEIDKQSSSSTNSFSTLPITKLRLKSSFVSSMPTNKRQLTEEQNNDEMTLKRMKMFNKIKADSESSQLPLNYVADVEIKEEPLDEDDHNMATNLIPEVIIKTEEEDKPEESWKNDSKPEMKSLLINNMMNPEFNGKIIPMSVQTLPNKMPVLKWITNTTNNSNNASNQNNTSLKTNLKFVKFTPTSIASSNRNIQNLTAFAANQNVNNGNIIPLPKTGLQILKFLPNTQLLTFKTKNQSATCTKNEAKQPMIIKFQTSSGVATQQQNLQHLTVKPINTSSPPPLVPTSWKNSIVIPITKTSTTPSTVSIKLNSLDQNTTIDAEDFKKLQAEALIKVEEHRKNFVIPKDRLMVIENLPEKRHLIDTMKKQIAQVELKTEQKEHENVTHSSSSKFACAKDSFVSTDKTVPPSLYLPISSKIDVDLVQARCQNPNFIYKFICPYCLTDYEYKRSLKSHLSKAHNLTMRDMEKINVQAKAFKNEEITIEVIPPIKKEVIKEENESQSESESMHADTSNSNSSPTTSPTPIKMSAFKANKISYICNKCGRKCSSKTMLNDHISANCSREPQYNCLQCPKKFYSHGTLQCHLTIHTGELPHKCSYCDKRFRTRGQVTVHHRTHTGERPFVCQVCAQRFTHRETLIAHLSRHIGMKRYKCYGCDKHFSCISALKTHREIRGDTCGKVKFNPRAIGPRVRVIRGNVVFEAQPEFNPYLKSEDPKSVLSELQNQPLKSK